MKIIALLCLLILPNTAQASPCSELIPTILQHVDLLERQTVFTVTKFTEIIKPSLQACLDSREYSWNGKFEADLQGAINSANATLAIGEEYKIMLLKFGGKSALATYEKNGANLAIGWLIAASDEQVFISRLKAEFKGRLADYLGQIEDFLNSQ